MEYSRGEDLEGTDLRAKLTMTSSPLSLGILIDYDAVMKLLLMLLRDEVAGNQGLHSQGRLASVVILKDDEMHYRDRLRLGSPYAYSSSKRRSACGINEPYECNSRNRK